MGPRPSRIPTPRRAAEDGNWPPPPAPGPNLEHTPPEGRTQTARTQAGQALTAQAQTAQAQPVFDHSVLKSLLGAWALAACTAEEAAALEAHLGECAACADEALRLRDAVGLLRPEENLDLDPQLRSRVLAGCLVRRPARVPMPEWAAPYDAETARLDALLHDMAEAEWRAPVRLHWFDGKQGVTERETTVAGVIGHLLAVDGMVAASLGLPDPLSTIPLPRGAGPEARTEAQWRTGSHTGPPYPSPVGTDDTPQAIRVPWREQGHSLIRTVSFAGRCTAELEASYGTFTLPVKDAFLERAFECWVHAGDIAAAVDYPYDPPQGPQLNLIVDLAARLLPGTIASRRRSGLATPAKRLSVPGAPGRTLHLEVEGSGGGDWYIPLDSPAASASPEEEVAHVALDGVEFCQLAAGHVAPQEVAAGQWGDREAIRDVLFAAASLSHL
ncbi:zf-HC2 domain-containing protein [Streptomyces sp. N2-109]|uniref:Zf-HC2 domain-containing protein n=1 Tax=Streptomyces gossypii TaxID=2883101 RepID=A0ABT2JXN1_9ACTN|nr:zf-HC2 domain-containing protein [Streptomyces gossypii]MCT2592657.1 zf-HC2 domain-containing protein [Streptomyces gossypii]